MNREEWGQEYARLLEQPLEPYLRAAGFSDEEISIIPAQTMGELPEVNLSDLYNADILKNEMLRFNALRMRLLPTIAEYALTGEWEKFCSMGQIHEVMQDAFFYFYDDMPEEYRRDFVIGCYQCHGDSIEECREALQDLRNNGRDELPEEYRNLEEITVYRAGAEPVDEAEEYFSWTLDEGVAHFFRNRFPWEGRHLYRAHIRPCDVIAYTDEREEREVIQYLSVYDVEEMETPE